MTREEAIKVLEKQFGKLCGNYRYQNAEKLDFEDALWVAISALRQQDVPDKNVGKNEPLTLKELRQMDGEPVWVCFSGSIIYEDGWFIITETEKCEALLKGKASVYKDFECYGKTWLAYRHKPEEGTI